MPAIARNGISGLAVRIATIAIAAVMFGCAPGSDAAAPATQPDAAIVSTPARLA